MDKYWKSYSSLDVCSLSCGGILSCLDISNTTIANYRDGASKSGITGNTRSRFTGRRWWHWWNNTWTVPGICSIGSMFVSVGTAASCIKSCTRTNPHSQATSRTSPHRGVGTADCRRCCQHGVFTQAVLSTGWVPIVNTGQPANSPVLEPEGWMFYLFNDMVSILGNTVFIGRMGND